MAHVTQATLRQTAIRLVQGDITQQNVDAIVNAANTSLLGGGGVDGAIHRAAGPELLVECRTLNGCPTGDAKITGGYRLPARHVIHAVGPVYGRADAPLLLASAYRRSLAIAIEHGLASIAFPAISTGVFGYPMGAAATIALATTCEVVGQQETVREVRFVLFTLDAFETFADALASLVDQRADLMAG